MSLNHGILKKIQKKQEELDGVLYELIETIRVSATLLQAFIPETASKIFDQINCHINSFDSTLKFGGFPNNHPLNKPEALFERYDLEKKMVEVLGWIICRNNAFIMSLKRS